MLLCFLRQQPTVRPAEFTCRAIECPRSAKTFRSWIKARALYSIRKPREGSLGPSRAVLNDCKGTDDDLIVERLGHVRPSKRYPAARGRWVKFLASSGNGSTRHRRRCASKTHRQFKCSEETSCETGRNALAQRPRCRCAELEGDGNQSRNQNLPWPLSGGIAPLMRERASPDTSDAL
jgi:hypothetical protein